MEDFVDAFFNLDIIRRASPILWSGLLQTLLLAVTVVPVGAVGGVLLGLLTSSPNKTVRRSFALWTDFFRGVPPLVLLVFIYAGLPFAGLDTGAWGAVVIGFLLNTSAYYGEILRAGIESVPRGQVEAARSTGLTATKTMGLVVLPQAVRNVLPDLVSNTLEVVKLTSIASVVAMPELLFQARQAQNATYNASPIVAAAIAYFIMLWPVVRLISRLENKVLVARR
ncbi:amino acid ABC transporter permease [Roseomonas terrae]|uniref:Amino acid ABC transporter permease n=1 Tax=Neoroseomonas terrae TaxID=424799 RepID=A0ABS5EIG8_9PROT|nr:amino acid ABC transporter permease [Neoroseomonas terrae]MBR0650824.1 amino acid ABC transporter permease [Neoroseomonas terrae]